MFGDSFIVHVQDCYISFIRNPGRDISFLIYTRKEFETKRIRKEINNITFKPLLIFPVLYIAEKKLKQEYWKGNQNKKYLVLST